MRKLYFVRCIVAMGLLAGAATSVAAAEGDAADAALDSWCQPVDGKRVMCADIAAIDQTLVYNRFGSFNPYGMMFALRRDLAPLGDAPDAVDCAEDTGTVPGNSGQKLEPGQVRLRDCKRPRPLTLRANVGDRLVVRVTNLLNDPARDLSHGFCGGDIAGDALRDQVRQGVSTGDSSQVAHGETLCDQAADASQAAPDGNWPATRRVNFVVQGLRPVPDDSGTINPSCLGTGAAEPGEDNQFLCIYDIPREGPYFLASLAAPAGGEGDGGSLVHGLFGAIVAERDGSTWYRSQTSQATLDAVWDKGAGNKPLHSRADQIRYEEVDTDHGDVPYLNMARAVGVPQPQILTAPRAEIVHSDLNAIVYCGADSGAGDCRADSEGVVKRIPGEAPALAFREFSVFFHDELKTFYTRNFEELGQLRQLAGVRDGFAINYGASGMGSLLLANRKGIGPSAKCMECLYEEFFLTSWANGDPALLERFDDDPSNVHHSYLNDPVVFRNFHAGPKETHVFHLHAHQWFGGNDPNRGSYLDSQTVAPQQGFTYNIYHGGLRDPDGEGKGWWGHQGAGNRNRTVGDSIFHCHLYPHFAQGMWALWRVHDVLEDGTRKLADGQAHDGLSLDFADRAPEFTQGARPGSVDLKTGAWNPDARGTPVPALIPLPGEPLPLLPSYANGPTWDNEAGTAVAEDQAPVPGYPYFIGGEPGHRPPQAPLDIARDLGAAPDSAVDARSIEATDAPWLDGGLPRHVVLDGSTRKAPFAQPTVAADDPQRGEKLRQAVAKAFALGDLTEKLTSAKLRLLDNAGTPLERAAMGFHYNGLRYNPEGDADVPLRLYKADGAPSEFDGGAYKSLVSAVPGGAPPEDPAVEPEQAIYPVNGSAPKPGAPFADPCGIPAAHAGNGAITDPLYGLDPAFHHDPDLTGYRRYEASAVQLDLIVNSAGWHDPQARINILTKDSDRFKDRAGTADRISPLISDREEPFFFRALSGECIEFRHTNELPKDLELDDFQVRTPTDTIGQHIHLVKFDVTSSDGSGNGWNYEDGTFAADEIALRRCASTQGSVEGGTLDIPLGECLAYDPAQKEIWRTRLSENRDRFQTTVQRWYADPILSANGADGVRDRTMRTVFTHDHFGPSSIQQHGFYGALMIEPRARYAEDGKPQHDLLQVCGTEQGDDCYKPFLSEDQLNKVAFGTKAMTGTRKLVFVRPPAETRSPGAEEIFEDPNYREFALSIADFALLYDPRDRQSERALRAGVSRTSAQDEKRGMARLYCEALWRLSPSPMGDFCGSAIERDIQGNWYGAPGAVPPAWIAGGMRGDYAHRDGLPDTIRWSEAFDLRNHLIDYREKAAGMGGSPIDAVSLAKPVAAPAEPESISVDHHDPYLVNYRGAPIPLRVGDKVAGNDHSADCAPFAMGRAGRHDGNPSSVEERLANGTFPRCSYERQLAGIKGDMGYAFSSALHGDPATPVLEAFANERIMIRLIQGAQEVQHGFRVLGKAFRRNPDQAFGAAMIPLGRSQAMKDNPTRHQICAEELAIGRPGQYALWRDKGIDGINAADEISDEDKAFWAGFEDKLALCDNPEGLTFVQEVGISEHFEIQGSLRADFDASLERAPFDLRPAAAGPDQSIRGVADLMYDFGSIDALWNGAWGLMRTFDDSTATDPATRQAIGQRLKTLAEASRSGLEGAEVTEPAETPDSGLTCPLNEGISRRAVIAAVETRELFGKDGTSYGGPRHDPDGLMLAPVPSSVWPAAGFWAAAEDWQALDRGALITALADSYSGGPQPFVMRVNAGDCVELRLVNLLSEPSDFAGLRDLLGDARMPPIAPLNVDPAQSEGPEAAAGSFVREMRLDRPLGGAPEGGLRPSARLALRVGLPGLDLIANVPSGIGYMDPPLDPSTPDAISISKPLTFYAGRARNVMTVNEIQTLADSLLQSVRVDNPDGTFSLAVDGVPTGSAPLGPYDGMSLIETDDTDGIVSILGHHFILTLFSFDPPAEARIGSAESPATADARQGICAADAECQADFDRMVQSLTTGFRQGASVGLGQRTHWIAYPFGAVPIISVGDMVSHAPHGLFGTIDVLPQDWGRDADGLPGYQPVEPQPGEPRPIQVLQSMPVGDGVPMTTTVAKRPGLLGEGGDYETDRIREYVLFFQDGLNLRDADSQTTWRWTNPLTTARDPDYSPARMVQNCPVCDDSYDFGEAGVNYRSVSFAQALRDQTGLHLEDHDDLNLQQFPPDFFPAAQNAVRLMACEGEQVVIRVLHPGGRARQRSFVMNSYGYEDLFPGFGFTNASLLTPGKSVTAWLTPRLEAGLAIWHDGPLTRRAGGTWGLIETVAAGESKGDLTCPGLAP